MDRIIAQSEDEFQRGVVSLRKPDLAAIVNLIQREMTLEQDEFNRLTERLERMDSSSRDFAYLEKARLQSQARLTSLMNKSMICLARKQDFSDGQDPPDPPEPAKAARPKKEAPKAPPAARPVLQPSSMHGSATLSASVRLAEAGDTQSEARGAKVRFSCPENGGEEIVLRKAKACNSSPDDVERPKNGGNTTVQPPKTAVQPHNTTVQPPKSTVQPPKSTSQPSKVSVQPSKVSVQPSKVSVQPSKVTIQSSKPSVQPSKPPLQPLNTTAQVHNSRVQPVSAPVQPDTGSTQPNGASNDSPPPTPSARSLIANFERLSSSGDTPGRAPRRSASTSDFGEAPAKPAGLPHSASMAQFPVKPRNGAAVTPRRVEIVERPPEAPKKPVEQKRAAPAKPPPVREPEVIRSSISTSQSAPKPVKPGTEEKNAAPAAPKDTVDGAVLSRSGGVVIGDEKVQPAPTLKFWDPAKLLAEMFKVRLAEEAPQPSSANACSGILDKLPDQKKKNTMLKTWKRRYFIADQGELRTFEAGVSDPSTAAPVQVFQLSGGRVEDLRELMIGVDDGCGRFVTLRCPTAEEHTRWLRALQLQAASEHRPHHVMPVPKAAPHPSRRVIIVDIGSCGIRAGCLKEAPTLPELHFPSMAALVGGEVAAVGCAAFAPSIRSKAQLVAPARAETTIENVAFERGILRAIFQHIFSKLKVEPSKTTILLSVPNTTSEPTRSKLCELLFANFEIPAVAMCGQAMLALYAYGLTTGVVVDLGHRMEILPVTDGVVQKGGVARQPFGGARIAETLNLHLSERGCRFHSEAELLLTRFVVQQAAFVCQDPDAECDVTNDQEAEIDLSYFDLPSDYRQSVSLLANGRCRCTEGLFNPPDYFGVDSVSLPRLVQRAIAACPMDLRRDLARRVVLSGGATLLPGTVERLERDLGKLLPAASQVKVHAAPNRLHAAFLGANRLAAMAEFEALCVTRAQWSKAGPRAIMGKWTV